MIDYLITETPRGGWRVQSADPDRPASDLQPTRHDAVVAARARARSAGGGLLTVRDVAGAVVELHRVTVPRARRGARGSAPARSSSARPYTARSRRA